MTPGVTVAARARYHGFIASGDRWDGLPMRDDDIVISTPSKTGTTCMQTLVALLLFDGVSDRPVYDLSPWLDMNTRSKEEVHGGRPMSLSNPLVC